MSMLETDCTVGCKLVHHGNLLIKSLTKRGISEEKLISYFLLTCRGFSKNLDENGRSALHLACSNSKPLVAEYLLASGAAVHQKDADSGWTALHRAVYYTCLDTVFILKRYGASFGNFDFDYLTPLQLLPQPIVLPSQLNCEFNALVWGKNKNYNLGLGNVTSREHPDTVKGLPPIDKASISKYHSLFLTTTGSLWGCGHSKTGRLGIGSESTVTSPQEISVKFNHKNEKICEVSCGLSHSLIRTNKSVYAAGSNKYLQLGIASTEEVLTFKEVQLDRTAVDLKNMLSIIACDYHSVFVSRSGIFICGLNAGQFGGIQESIEIPRRLPYPSSPTIEVEFASSNNACICAYLCDKKVHYFYIFYNRKIKTYKNPLNERFQQCLVLGGEMLCNDEEIVQNSTVKPLTIVTMTEHKNLYIWYEDILQFVKIHISSLFTTQIVSIYPCGDRILMLANSHLFQASFQHKLSKLHHLSSEYQEHSTKKDIAQFLCSKLTIKRVSHVSNVKSVCCDLDGESFIAIASHTQVRVNEPDKDQFDFSTLLEDDHFAQSGILDYTFIVKKQQIKANRFVVESRCGYLKKLMDYEGKSSTSTIADVRVTPDMFKCILLWIFKNHLTEADLQMTLQSVADEESMKKIAQDFHDIAVKWNLDGVCNTITNSKTMGKIITKPHTMNIKIFKWFQFESLPELYDVTILLDENQKLRAHKVVLVMRIEYFKMMFYHNWSESSSIDLRHIAIEYMRPIVQFAYDNNAEKLRKEKFSDNFLYNMVAILDQYLMENIKNIFESILMRKVNLRNCAENLEFSVMYNCFLLKDHCMHFICLNLSRLLEGNFLDNLDQDILKELSIFCRKYFKFETDSNHIITPDFDAPTDEAIEELIADFDFLTYNDAISQELKKTPKSKNRLSKSEMSRRNYEKEGIKNLQHEEKLIESVSVKSPEVIRTSISEDFGNPKDWHQRRERKDSARKKAVVASKVNEIMKADTVQHEPMIDLKNLRNSLSEEFEPTRSIITLADFGIKTKKKTIIETTPTKPEEAVARPAWNMENVELKPISSDFPSISAKPSSSKKAQKSPAQKNFSSIVRDEQKDRSKNEKIKSKPLLLTQIEERAIAELSEFYNIDNIFDESIKVHRKTYNATQNLSTWRPNGGIDI